MGALKMNLRKALAAFLCVCLLVSYDPIFGAAGAAFADEPVQAQSAENDGDGHLSGNGMSQEELDAAVADSAGTITGNADEPLGVETTVTVSTFDGSLAAACRSSFSATLEELERGTANGTDVSYIWYEVTGGFPGSNSANPYNATWQVFANGAFSQQLTNWVNDNGATSVNVSTTDNVTSYKIMLQALAAASANSNSLLKNNQAYTFVGTFTDSQGAGAVQRVTLYTVANDVINFKETVLYGHDELEGVEAAGKFDVPNTQLSGGNAADSSPAKEAMENKAAEDTLGGSGNFAMGDVLQVGTNPVKLPGTSGVDIPPFDGDSIVLRLPIDEAYTGEGGYQEGDEITVLWSGDDSGKVVPVKATVVRADDGQLKAQLAYPYSGDADGDGVDDTGWPALPGYFGIEYDTSKSNDPSMQAEYFSVRVEASGNGIVTPSGKTYWRVKKSGGPEVTPAMFAIAPLSSGEKAYELTALTLTRENGSGSYNFLQPNSGADLTKVGALSQLRTSLALTNSSEVFAAGSSWVLTARFAEQQFDEGGTVGTHRLTVKAGRMNGSTFAECDFGTAQVYYYNAEGDYLVEPAEGGPASSVSLDMPNNRQATINFFPKAPVDGKYYELQELRVKVGSSTQEGQAPTNPLVIPATASNVEVQAIFEETEVGSFQPASYTVSASVINPEFGSIQGADAQGVRTFTYGDNSAVEPLVFKGAEETNYLDYVNVYVGDRAEPIRLNVNYGKADPFTLYLPNYHADVRVEGYFNDKKAPSIELTLNVETYDANGQLMANANAGGQLVPLGWTITDMVRSGQKCTLLLSANPGFELQSVMLGHGSEAPVDVFDQVRGGIWPFVPTDDRVEPADALKMVVTVAFKQKSNGQGGSGTEPGDTDGAPARVSAYVADEALNNAANVDLAYIWGAGAGDLIEIDGKDASAADLLAAISVQGQKASFGTVNGKPSLMETVPYDSDLPLTFLGATQGDTTYELEKVLAVSYVFDTDASGNQVKKGLKWQLVNTSVPLYVLDNVTANTDVIGFFEAADAGDKPVFGDDDFVEVTVTSNVPGTVNQSGTVKVLKGSQLLLSIALETADQRLASVTVKKGAGQPVDVTSAVRAEAIPGTSTASYLLSGIDQATEVVVTYQQKPEEEVTRYAVEADLKVLDENGGALDASAAAPCAITVGTGENFAQQSIVRDGAGNGVALAAGSDLRLSLVRDYGYRLKDLSLVWSDQNVFAYQAEERQDDGSVRKVVRFTTDRADLLGKKPYESGASLYDGAEPEDLRSETWYVQNLLAAVTVAPVYQKQAQVEQPDDDAWTITTKVGRGAGTVITDSPAFTGSVTKVPKGSVTAARPLTVTFQPDEGYKLVDIQVSASTGNAFADFWANVLGFVTGRTDEAKMKEDALKNGFLKLARVDKDYTITADFEQIPDAVSPDDPVNSKVAVNVVYDPDKGSVEPNTGLMVARDGSQQFVVSPVKVEDKFYSIVAVKVTAGDGETHEVRAIDKGSKLVVWGDPFYNTFVVNMAELGIPASGAGSDAAVTVEVLFSDTPDVSENEGGNTGPVSPGTPTVEDVKSVVVNAVSAEGASGTVSPQGAFSLVPQKAGAGSDALYEQRVYVAPSRDSLVDTISVTRNGEEMPSVANAYLRSVTEHGYFTVEAEPVGTETVTVYFALKPLAERSYSVTVVGTGVSGAQSYVKPGEPVSVADDADQTITIDPPAGVWVVRVDDAYIDASGAQHVLPVGEGVGYVRGTGDNEALNVLHVKPLTKNGEVVDRVITVQFQLNSNVDHGIPDSEKADLHVAAFGDGSEFLRFTPAEDMNGVLKGTADEPAAYTYRFEMDPVAASDGYGIYRVQVNGEDVVAPFEGGSTLRTEGEFTFTTENMTREVNTLFVYVKKFDEAGSVVPGDPDDPNAWMTVVYGAGTGGTIADKNPSAHGTASTGAASAADKAMTVAKGEPFTLLMTPDNGYVLSAVYLHNCYVLEYGWVAPSDGRTAKIALEYTLKVKDESAPARVFAAFKKGDANTFKPWDWSQVGSEDYLTDGTFTVEISPASSVEALVESANGTPRAGDMLHMANPVAPFSPSVTAKTPEPEPGTQVEDDPWADIFGGGEEEEPAAVDGSYELTYDTISGLSDNGKVRILVGPLLKWNDDHPEQGTLYTLDSLTGLDDGFTVVERPLNGSASRASLAAATEVDVTGDGSEGDEADDEGEGVEGDGDGEQAAEPAGKPSFYTYYEINGMLSGAAAQAEGDGSQPVVRINLRKLALTDGEFPEYADRIPAGMARVHTQVVGGEGTITPTSTTPGTAWFGSDLVGPWLVAKDSSVTFKVEPAEGYVLSTLTCNDTDALNGTTFDAETSTLTFRVSDSTLVAAEFVTEDSPEAMRNVTIEVEGEHGTTSPEPGTYQVEKGKPYSISFQADAGYVPYRIWVDGVESFVAPTLTGWMLPAWWHDQTFKVEFALAGTTPTTGDHLNQTGQNLLNKAGTALVKTGDNPWLPAVVLLVVVGAGALLVGRRMLRASEAASRAAKYSVKPKDEE